MHLLKRGKGEVDAAFLHLGFANLPRSSLIPLLHLGLVPLKGSNEYFIVFNSCNCKISCLVPWNSSLYHLAVLLPGWPSCYCHIHHYWNPRWNLKCIGLINGLLFQYFRLSLRDIQIEKSYKSYHLLLAGPVICGSVMMMVVVIIIITVVTIIIIITSLPSPS